MGGRRQSESDVCASVLHKQGQAAMEFLLVVAFGFILIVLVMVVAYTQSSQFSQEVTAAQVQKVGNQMTDAANIVFYQGPPTKKTITVYFPDHIKNVTFGNQSIVFTISTTSGNSEYVVWAAANMTGAVRSFTGLHVLMFQAYDTTGSVNVNVTDS